MRTPATPKNLCPEAKKLWRDIHKGFDLGPDATEILRVACLALTRYMGANDQLSKEGVTYLTKTGQIKKNPAAEIEKNALSGFLQAMRLLGVEYEQPKPRGPGRPPERG